MSKSTGMALALLLGCLACEPPVDRDVQISPETNPRGIVGGTPTNYESWQGVVGLIYWLGSAGQICTGTLIHPRLVLTAGHCVYLPSDGVDATTSPEKLEIRGGADMLAGDAIIYTTARAVRRHESWQGNIQDSAQIDLALVELSLPIDDVETYPLRSKEVSVLELGTLVGYGLLSSSRLDSAGVHREGLSTVLTVENRLIELGSPSGTCQGDSGGPFFTKVGGRWELTGVTSFGSSYTCLADSDGWDINVFAMRDWIEQTSEAMLADELDTQSDTGTDDEISTDTATDGNDDGTDDKTDTPGAVAADTGTQWTPIDSTDTGSQTDSPAAQDGEGVAAPFGTDRDNPIGCSVASSPSQQPRSLLMILDIALGPRLKALFHQ